MPSRSHAHAAEPPPPGPPPWPAELSEGSEITRSHLHTMRLFFETQERVFRACIRAAGPPPPAVTAEPDPAPPPPHARAWPLLGTVIASVPGQSLTAVRTFDVTHDLFLEDHTLGSKVSAFDEGLRALPILPVLFSIEMMCEAALALAAEDRVVVGLEDVRAHRWIALETGQIRLQTTGRFVSGSADALRVRVVIREDREARLNPILVEATVILASAYPSETVAPRVQLHAPVDCRWTATDIYPRRTFHGRRFQGVQGVDRIGANGLMGRIGVLPQHTLFRLGAPPALALDPLLLDCMGQLLWIWDNHDPEAAHIHLPFHVGTFRLHAPPLSAETSLRVDLEVREQSEGLIACDVRARRDDGAVVAEILNLRNRVFEIPLPLKRMILQPLESALSTVWQPPPAVTAWLGGHWVFTRLLEFPPALLHSSFGVWLKVWAFLVLSPPERREWFGLRDGPHHQIEWLATRTAAKDAVRELLHAQTPPQNLGAADIVMGTHATGGGPIVSGGWRGRLHHCPRIAMAHTAELTVAAACEASAGLTPGIAVARLDAAEPAQEDADLLTRTDAIGRSPDDGALREWQCRVYAARRAVMAACVGLPGRDASPLHVARIDPRDGRIELVVRAPVAAALGLVKGDTVTAMTFVAFNHAIAICQRPAAVTP